MKKKLDLRNDCLGSTEATKTRIVYKSEVSDPDQPFRINIELSGLGLNRN